MTSSSAATAAPPDPPPCGDRVLRVPSLATEIQAHCAVMMTMPARGVMDLGKRQRHRPAPRRWLLPGRRPMVTIALNDGDLIDVGEAPRSSSMR